MDKKNVTLFFINGDSVKIISYVSSGMKIVKYRINEDSKKIKVNYRKVKKAVRHFKSRSTTYTYKKRTRYTNYLRTSRIG